MKLNQQSDSQLESMDGGWRLHMQPLRLGCGAEVLAVDVDWLQ